MNPRAPGAPHGSDPLPEALTAGIAMLRLSGRLRRIGSQIQYYESVTSTNDLASPMVGNDGAVVVADAQTAGRGRRGRRWFSPRGRGLYVSVVTAPQNARADPDRATALLTLAAGVALAEAIEAVTGLAADIKWPNDLLVSGRKVAGILAEASTVAGSVMTTGVVLGYGINVIRLPERPPEATGATSLEDELRRPIDRMELLLASLEHLDRRYDDLLGARFDAILESWRARAPFHRGTRVCWSASSGVRRGVTQGVDDWGALLVAVDSGVERIVSGEVRWDRDLEQ